MLRFSLCYLLIAGAAAQAPIHWSAHPTYVFDVDSFETPNPPKPVMLWNRAKSGFTGNEFFSGEPASNPAINSSESNGHLDSPGIMIKWTGGLCLQAAQVSNGAPIHVDFCDSAKPTQRWTLMTTAHGQKIMSASNNAFCVNVKNAPDGAKNGQRLEVWECNNDLLQSFTGVWQGCAGLPNCHQCTKDGKSCIECQRGFQNVHNERANSIGQCVAKMCSSPDKSTHYIHQHPNFIAIDATTGKRKWSFALNTAQKSYTWQTSCMSSPTGSVVYVSNVSHGTETHFCENCSSVIAIDASAGKQKWVARPFSTRVKFEILTTSSTLYVRDYEDIESGAKGIYAVDAKTGAIANFDGVTFEDASSGVEDMPMMMNLDKSVIYIADQSKFHAAFSAGGVHAFDAHTAKLQWFFGNFSKYCGLAQSADGLKLSADGLKLVISAEYCPNAASRYQGHGATPGKFVVDAISGKQIGTFTPTSTSSTFLV